MIRRRHTIVTEAAWNEELNAKHAKAHRSGCSENKLAGVLIRRNENVAWLTGGAVELRVLTPGETGVASLLVTAEGKRYYFTTENEAPRLHDEEFGALDFEPVLFPWYADDTLDGRKAWPAALSAQTRPLPGTTPVNLFPLRASLSESGDRALSLAGRGDSRSHGRVAARGRNPASVNTILKP